MLAESPELCTPEELAAYWPGGSENTIPGRGSWYYCFQQYGRLLGRLERIENDADEARGEQAALDAVQELPLSVTLTDPGAEGKPQTLQVYPKSYEVISFCDGMDTAVRWLLARADALIQADSTESVLAAQDGLATVARVHQLLCWIACTPGPGSPYPIEQPPPDPPEPFRSLSPLDVMRVMGAYAECNRTRIALTVSLLRPLGEESKRVQWSVLAAGAAKSMNQPIEAILKHRAFATWVAQFVLTSRAEIEQAERARQQQHRPDRAHERVEVL